MQNFNDHCNEEMFSSVFSSMFQIAENGEYSCECPGCDYKSKSKSAVKKHIKAKHFDLRNYPCNACSYIAKTSQSLIWHVSGVHGDDVKICPECGFKSKWLASLNGHIKSVHRGIKRRTDGIVQTCPYCDHTSLRKDLMTKHIKGKHTNEPIKCEKCLYSTTLPDLLARHVKTGACKENTGLEHICGECTYSSNNPECLEQHFYFTHGNGSEISFEKNELGTFTCNLCEYTAMKMSHIKRHAYFTHKNNKSLK